MPPYFKNFIPHYGAYRQNLRNNHIRLPAIRCEFEKTTSKYQMHFRLRELASPSNPTLLVYRPGYFTVHPPPPGSKWTKIF